MKFLIGLGFRLGFVPIFIFLLTVLLPRSLFPVLVASSKLIDLDFSLKSLKFFF